MAKKEELEYCKRWLRKKFPTDYPVRVVLCKSQHPLLKGDKGKTNWIPGKSQFESRFIVAILSNLNQEETIGILLHEWAHVLRDHMPRDAFYNHHDEIHSVLAGRIWREWTAHIHPHEEDDEDDQENG